MNQALTRSASLPMARRISEISNSEVGQTSGAVGEAEEDQGGTTLQVLFGHTRPGLIGELERAADRGRRGNAAHAAHRPQHHQQPDEQAGGKGGVTITSGRAAVRSINSHPQKQLAKPAAMVSKNTAVP